MAENVPPEGKVEQASELSSDTCHLSSVECQGKRYISCRTLERGAELVEDDWIVQSLALAISWLHAWVRT